MWEEHVIAYARAHTHMYVTCVSLRPYFQKAIRSNAHALQACVSSLGDESFLRRKLTRFEILVWKYSDHIFWISREGACLFCAPSPPKNQNNISNFVNLFLKSMVSQGTNAILGGERERLLPDAGPPSTIQLTFLNAKIVLDCSWGYYRVCILY